MSDWTSPFPIPMITAGVTDELTSDPVPLGNCRQHWHGVTFAPDTTSGVLEVELAPTKDGPWVSIPLTVDASTALAGEISWPGLGGWVRHRISTVVAGGAAPSVTSTMKRINIA